MYCVIKCLISTAVALKKCGNGFSHCIGAGQGLRDGGGAWRHNGPICYLTIIIIIIMTIMTMTQICMNNECEKR